MFNDGGFIWHWNGLVALSTITVVCLRMSFVSPEITSSFFPISIVFASPDALIAINISFTIKISFAIDVSFDSVGLARDLDEDRVDGNFNACLSVVAGTESEQQTNANCDTNM